MGVTSTSSFFLYELCTRYAIRAFSNFCGMEVYSVEKSYVYTDVAVRHPVGRVTTTGMWSFQDPCIAYPIVAGLSRTVPYQAIYNGG